MKSIKKGISKGRPGRSPGDGSGDAEQRPERESLSLKQRAPTARVCGCCYLVTLRPSPPQIANKIFFFRTSATPWLPTMRTRPLRSTRRTSAALATRYVYPHISSDLILVMCFVPAFSILCLGSFSLCIPHCFLVRQCSTRYASHLPCTWTRLSKLAKARHRSHLLPTTFTCICSPFLFISHHTPGAYF